MGTTLYLIVGSDIIERANLDNRWSRPQGSPKADVMNARHRRTVVPLNATRLPIKDKQTLIHMRRMYRESTIDRAIIQETSSPYIQGRKGNLYYETKSRRGELGNQNVTIVRATNRRRCHTREDDTGTVRNTVVIDECNHRVSSIKQDTPRNDAYNINHERRRRSEQTSEGS